MPQYWRLTGLDASNYVVVRQNDKHLLSSYPLATPSSIESMMDYWLANPLERDILRNICAAVARAAAATTDVQVKKTLGAALQSQQLLAAEIPYAVTALEGVTISAPARPHLRIQIGFISHRDGGNIRTLPAEQPGSRCLTPTPLPPGTRLVVLGSSSPSPEWVHVAASWGGHIVRGYIQGFRVTTDLPEPAATLYQVKPNDTLEPIAARIYHQAIQPGRDLRFYENVILYINQQTGRRGVRRVNGDVQLVAGECIWLVSVAFANQLQGIVPSGSLTGGAIAHARQVGRHIEDLLASVRRAPEFMEVVAGDYWKAIQEHLVDITLVILAFIAAEALSALLAATPTGVGQLAAAVIQIGLALFGAQGVAQAGAMALQHAADWINLAWTASGDTGQIGEASKSFCHMVVNIAMAALGVLGVKANTSRAVTLMAESVKFTPPSLAVIQVAGGGQTVAVINSDIQAVAATALPDPASGPIAGVLQHAKPKKMPAEHQPHKHKPAEQQLTKRPLEDAELEKLLDKLPNWEGIKEFVGRPIPKPGTPEFISLKVSLKKAGYQLEALKESKQPFRLKRLTGTAQGDELAALTVTEEGFIVLRTGKSSRLSVYSRYRSNYLDWVQQTYGSAAREAAAIRIASGHQLHHLIPDEIAQSHALVKEALKRLERYTIDRGTNLLDMPSGPNASEQLIHLGNHPKYSKFVISKLDDALKEVTRKGQVLLNDVRPANLDRVLLRIEGELRHAIESGGLPDEVLKELLEEGLPVGKKLAMLEIRRQGEWLTA